MRLGWPPLWKSIFAAFVASWLGTAALVAAEELRFMRYLLDSREGVQSWLIDGAGTFVGTLLSAWPLVTLLPMIVVGLPAQAFLQHAGKPGYIWNIVPAITGGTIALPLLAILSGSVFEWDSVGIGAGTAFLVGSIAWLIRRPDKDAKVA